MTRVLLTCLTLLAMLALLQPSVGGEKKDETYIKVEARGTLQTGIMAIGGETTGTLLKTKAASVELDFGKNKDLRDAAEKLGGKTVLVTGTLTQKAGVTVRGVRTIVVVTTLKEAKE